MKVNMPRHSGHLDGVNGQEESNPAGTEKAESRMDGLSGERTVRLSLLLSLNC